MDSDDLTRKIDANTDAIADLTVLLGIQGKSIAELRDVLSDLSKLRDKNAQDIAALAAENHTVNEDLKTLLQEIRGEIRK